MPLSDGDTASVLSKEGEGQGTRPLPYFKHLLHVCGTLHSIYRRLLLTKLIFDGTTFTNCIHYNQNVKRCKAEVSTQMLSSLLQNRLRVQVQ